jgi:hypothetical protein
MANKHGGYDFTDTGLVVRDGWTPELWEEAGHEIARCQKGLMWLIGDWLNAGDREGYVERGKLDQACERFGIAYQTAKDSAWVAAAFPERSDRSDHLEWTHHRVVAGRDDAAELLEWAEAEGATVKQLRERVRSGGRRRRSGRCSGSQDRQCRSGLLTQAIAKVNLRRQTPA